MNQNENWYLLALLYNAEYLERAREKSLADQVQKPTKKLLKAVGKGLVKIGTRLQKVA